MDTHLSHKAAKTVNLNKIAIAAFAKHPERTAAKTRLARDIGQAQATRVYHELVGITSNALDAAVSQCQQHTPPITLTPYWAMAEHASAQLTHDGTYDTGLNSGRHFSALWTGDGGLGQRMQHIHTQLLENHQGAILIGSDCPTLSAEVLVSAINALQQHPEKLLLGPSMDGGFYLLASTQPLPSAVWHNTLYSCDSTLEQLIKNTQAHTDMLIHTLPPQWDIDTLDDLTRAREQGLIKGTSCQTSHCSPLLP